MEELEKLIQKAEARIDKRLSVYRNGNGKYDVLTHDEEDTQDLWGLDVTQAIARLKELATPKDITVTIPYDKASKFANVQWDKIGYAEPVADIIRKELKRVETE